MTNTLLAAAHDLQAFLSERSDEIEANATLPREVVDAVAPSGAFRQYAPAAIGGPGVTAWESLQVIEAFGYADSAVGWCVMIGSTTSLLANFLDPEIATKLFGDGAAIGGGFAMPKGKAQAVDGGLSVTGTWQWGSGTKHCTTIGGGAQVVDAAGEFAPRSDGLAMPFVFFDPADVTFIETWDVAGLSGTGSVDYQVTNAFAPEGHWVEIGTSPARFDDPYARISFYGLLASGIAAAAVGIGRRAIDELIDLAATKKPQGSRKPLAARSATQSQVAEAQARLGAAWALMEREIEAAWESSVAGDEPDGEQRRRIRMAATHATQTAASVAESMYKCGGGAAVYRTSPLQRCFRDASVAAQHAMVAPRIFEVTGRMALGLETDIRML